MKNLVKVKQRSEIPAGFYACKAYVYQCPVCQKKIAKLLVILPVRDKDQLEDNFLYEDLALLRFLEEK